VSSADTFAAMQREANVCRRAWKPTSDPRPSVRERYERFVEVRVRELPAAWGWADVVLPRNRASFYAARSERAFVPSGTVRAPVVRIREVAGDDDAAITESDVIVGQATEFNEAPTRQGREED
jgi:hypothetical protein